MSYYSPFLTVQSPKSMILGPLGDQLRIIKEYTSLEVLGDQAVAEPASSGDVSIPCIRTP